MEHQLADITAAVLGVTVVGANDNFFELGGDSILAIQVVARAQEAGIGLSPLDLFEHPTIALLAQVATTTDTSVPASDAEPATDAEPVAVGEQQPVTGAVPQASDFPLARVDQTQLDALLRGIANDTR